MSLRRPAFWLRAGLLVGAILLGILGGALIAKLRVGSASDGTSAAPAPTDGSGGIVAAHGSPVPVPTATAALRIGFYDERTQRFVVKPVVATKVGQCIVVAPRTDDLRRYPRVVGRAAIDAQGSPLVQVQPEREPGYCLAWSAPSPKGGYRVSASAVVAGLGDERALATGSARVIVLAQKAPKSAHAARDFKKGSGTPRHQPSRDDQ